MHDWHLGVVAAVLCAALVTVAEEGTVSRASERLRVSPSAISPALTELERALKVQLCVRREAHGVTLTASGTQLLRHARTLLRRARELETELANPDGALSGLLSVGCFMGLAPVLLPKLLQGFGNRHPGVTIGFEEGDQTGLQQRLLAGKLDLVMLYDVSLSPEIRVVELTRMRPHVMLAADHRLAHEPVVALHDLADEPVVLLQEPPSPDHSLGLCHEAGITPVVRYRARNGETARALVGRGLGYAIIMQRPPNDRSYEGLCVVHKEIAELPDRDVPVVLGWPRRTCLTRRAEAFVRYSSETATAG
ncbi:LysR substrate-binding domain-containing protein [Amycolatopsis acidiphila]|uniref:LysR family transcriptional regulator n=1 Tax=Amycolatopsis acidiphila TaxID=715473 RepID=A0A558AP91_9PSEU|nr:LysR substrate-binding domain-containing protein [Amycolatopsis acidiphila]TVT26090.1 LysR family transcriptional regulator [Amycolatopsis acidiphila]UIJ63184.1 LysR substrate-binding domain-containing protein [Amycolatopsis acidiphila]